MYKNRIKCVNFTKLYTTALSCGQCEHFHQSILRVGIATPLGRSREHRRDANITRLKVPQLWEKRLKKKISSTFGF